MSYLSDQIHCGEFLPQKIIIENLINELEKYGETDYFKLKETLDTL